MGREDFRPIFANDELGDVSPFSFDNFKKYK